MVIFPFITNTEQARNYMKFGVISMMYYDFFLNCYNDYLYSVPTIRNPIAYNMHHIGKVRKKNQRNKNQKRIRSRSK